VCASVCLCVSVLCVCTRQSPLNPRNTDEKKRVEKRIGDREKEMY